MDDDISLGRHRFNETERPASSGGISVRMVAIAAIVLILVALYRGHLPWFR